MSRNGPAGGKIGTGWLYLGGVETAIDASALPDYPAFGVADSLTPPTGTLALYVNILVMSGTAAWVLDAAVPSLSASEVKVREVWPICRMVTNAAGSMILSFQTCWDLDIHVTRLA